MSEKSGEIINILTGVLPSKAIDENRNKNVLFLTTVIQKSTQIIEKTRKDLTSEEDYEQIMDKLSINKEEINLVIMEESFNQFDRQAPIEDYINDLMSGKYKSDQEIQTLVINLIQLFTDWKAEMKMYIAKSPLL